MNINWLLQNGQDTDTFENVLKKVTKQDIKKVFLVISCMKDSGFKIIEEELYGMKTKTKVLLGIDKKNTTKSMLENMLKLAKDVYLYSNNQDVEIDMNIYIFECLEKAYVYYISGNLSDGGIKKNIALYPEIIYDLNKKEDKEKFKEMKLTLEKQVITEDIVKLSKEYIDKLVDSKEIFSTSIYSGYSVKSISDLLKEKDNKTGDDGEYNEEKPNLKLDVKDIDFDSDLDIEFEGIEEIKEETKEVAEDINLEDMKQEYILKEKLYDDFVNSEEPEEQEVIHDTNEEASDLESLIFEKPSIVVKSNKIDMEKEKIKKEELLGEKRVQGSESELKIKKIDLNKVSNLIMQLPSKATKGKDKDAIKVPSYIRDLIPHFFSLSEKGRNEIREDGTYKVKDITLEIINVQNEEKHVDNKALIMQKQGQTYLTINSTCIDEVNYEENDIVRIIKLSESIYRCEIINSSLREYSLWEKMCTQNFKGTNRSYGVM